MIILNLRLGFQVKIAEIFLRKGGFSGILAHFLVPVAQLEECRFPKPKVAGSNPVGCAKFYFRANDGIVCGNSLKRVNAFRAFFDE